MLEGCGIIHQRLKGDKEYVLAVRDCQVSMFRVTARAAASKGFAKDFIIRADNLLINR
jgi:hypothetical protein